MKVRNLLFVMSMSLFMLQPAIAMRCAEKLVYEGDSKFDILNKCGEPIYQEVYDETVPLYNAAGYQIGTTTRTYDKWYYQQSPNEFRYELLFNGGVLKDIKAYRSR